MAEESLLEASRRRVVQGLSLVEDVVYVGLGLLLTIVALTLLVLALKNVVSAVWSQGFSSQIVGLLDQILLVLLIIELLYTVQVSFREHGLLAEPFLVVALIAVIRRVLVLTAQIPELPQAGEDVFKHYMYELSVLTVMILVLVGSLVVLQRHNKQRDREQVTGNREQGIGRAKSKTEEGNRSQAIGHREAATKPNLTTEHEDAEKAKSKTKEGDRP